MEGGAAMPYKSISDLPDTLRKILPHHAQEIYFEAFNHSWNSYHDSKKRKENKSLEETAHSVAWAAVKHKYYKGDDHLWHENSKS